MNNERSHGCVTVYYQFRMNAVFFVRAANSVRRMSFRSVQITWDFTCNPKCGEWLRAFKDFEILQVSKTLGFSVIG
jgi:hypothetical protein